MSRSIISIIILALAANSLCAQLSGPRDFPKTKSDIHQPPVRLTIDQNPLETITTVSLTGRNSWDWQGFPINEHQSVDLGSMLGTPGGPVRVTGLGWDTTLSTIDPSYACEAVTGFSNLLFLTPGFADCFPVTSAPYSSNGIVDLVGQNLDFVLTDGILDIEWFESFDDFPDAIDATYESGELAFEFEAFVIPDPPTAIDLGAIANAGERVVLDTIGSEFDTMLALYDSQGNVLQVNDDFNSLQSLIAFHDAPAGTYYVGVGAFFTAFGPFWDVDTSQSFSNGNYVLNYTATDSITGFLEPLSVNWYKFEVVPEPSSIILLLAGASLLWFRRR